MDIYGLLDEIQSIARSGLSFTRDVYDRERYEHLLRLAEGSYSNLLALPEELVRLRFSSELGCITPKLGTSAAIFNSFGDILLMERADGSGWCLPCGWVEANEKPVEAVVREVLEETGLTVWVKGLVGVFTRLPGAKTGPHTTVSVLHLCEVVAGELRLSQEGCALGYCAIEAVEHWHPNHEKYARAAYRVWQLGQLLPGISD
jgi:ADP-ribose pyrophosphatase YjhB (NUDIX family)